MLNKVDFSKEISGTSLQNGIVVLNLQWLNSLVHLWDISALRKGGRNLLRKPYPVVTGILKHSAFTTTGDFLKLGDMSTTISRPQCMDQFSVQGCRYSNTLIDVAQF